MKMTSLALLPLLVLAVCLPASAATIETVLVGNTGNLPDSNGLGAVDYLYRIGTYEVTNTQYAEFLNAVAAAGDKSLYKDDKADDAYQGISRAGDAGSYTYSVKPGYENRPAAWVGQLDAVRFVNWLHNGQQLDPNTTEYGAYNFVTDPAWQLPGSIARDPAAKWFLPSKDEWYKAAYHKNDGDTGNYYAYPTSSDIAPTNTAPTDAPNSANYSYAVASGQTDVGAYSGSASPYGTFDQGGNIEEWTDSQDSAWFRWVGGGAWNDANDASTLISSYASSRNYTNQDGYLGFRVATVVPEPSAILLMVSAIVIVGPHRRRKAV